MSDVVMCNWPWPTTSDPSNDRLMNGTPVLLGRQQAWIIRLSALVSGSRLGDGGVLLLQVLRRAEILIKGTSAISEYRPSYYEVYGEEGNVYHGELHYLTTNGFV